MTLADDILEVLWEIRLGRKPTKAQRQKALVISNKLVSDVRYQGTFGKPKVAWRRKMKVKPEVSRKLALEK